MKSRQITLTCRAFIRGGAHSYKLGWFLFFGEYCANVDSSTEPQDGYKMLAIPKMPSNANQLSIVCSGPVQRPSYANYTGGWVTNLAC
jgi:hypothetical protein